MVKKAFKIPFFRMKNFTILFFLFLLFSHRVIAQSWEPFNIPGDPRYLLDFAVVQGTPFAVFNNGLFRGNFGGQQWEKIRAYDAEASGYYMFAVNYENNKVYFNGNTDSIGSRPIYESPDLGKTWKKLPVGDIRDMAFIGDTLYFFENYNLFSLFGANTPKNALVKWPKDTAGLIQDLAAEGTHLWVMTRKGVYHSPDAGYTWHHSLKRNIPLVLAGTPLVFPMQGKVYCHSKNINPVFRSDDQGITWQEIPWSQGPIFRSAKRLYTCDAAQQSYLLRMEGDPLPSDTIQLHASQNLDIKGAGETGAAIWLGTNSFGIGYSTPDDTYWKIANTGIELAEPSMGWRDGFLFSGNRPPAFSSDQGNTWSQTFSHLQSRSPQRKGNNYSGLSTSVDQMLICPANGRFEWEVQYSLPEKFSTLTRSGDTLIGSGAAAAYNVHRSTDDGQSWENISANIKGPVYFYKGKLYGFRDSSCVMSADAGDTWSALFKFPVWMHPTRYKFYLFGDTFLVTYPTLDRLYYSADGGQSFDTLSTPKNAQSNYFEIRPLGHRLYLSHNDGELYMSANSGQTWNPLPHPKVGQPFLSQVLGSCAGDDARLFILPGYRLRYDQFRNAYGAVFLDANSNGLRDFLEPGLNGYLVKSDASGAIGASYNGGHFSLLLSPVVDTLRLVTIPRYYTAAPALKTIPASGAIPTVYFGLKPQGQINDAAIATTTAGPFRAGYSTTLQTQVKNLGTVAISGQIRLVSDPLLTFLQANPAPDAQAGDTLIWNFNNLSPLQVRQYRIDVRTAQVAPGTPLRLFATSINGMDVDEANNVHLLNAIVVSSYDPNDKAVSRETIPVAEAAGSDLMYTIRFQNLGNTTTDFITIRDTLSDAIDPTSVRVTQASHAYSWSLEDKKVLVFRFNPIKLSPADVDSLQSQGFIQFFARLRSGLPVGADIANTAHIYFDFNPAIVTNTVHTVLQTVGLFEPVTLHRPIDIFPNPANTTVRFRLPEGVEGTGRLELFDTAGRLVRVQATTGATHDLGVENMAMGMYWCRWDTANGAYWGKLLVVQ